MLCGLPAPYKRFPWPAWMEQCTALMSPLEEPSVGNFNNPCRVVTDHLEAVFSKYSLEEFLPNTRAGQHLSLCGIFISSTQTFM